MKEIRCKKCKRLLMKGDVKRIEIKCPKCGYIQLIEDNTWDNKSAVKKDKTKKEAQ